MTTLSKLLPGDRARVHRVDGSGAVRQRLLDLGVLPAVDLVVQRVAPAGDPIWIGLGGTQLSLRRAEAATVIVAVE